jgi:hypothetical protein
VNAGLATKIHTRKKQISQLSFQLVMHLVEYRGSMRINRTTRIEMNADLGKLFFDLRGRT